MKDLFNQHKTEIVIGGIAVVAFVGILLFLLQGSGGIFSEVTGSRTKIEAKNSTNGNSLTVYSDGSVEVSKGSEVYRTYWDKNKVDAFLSYQSSVYGNESFSYENDELLDEIINETSGGGSQTPDDGQDIADFFNTPTPAPTSSPGGSGGSGGPTPTPDPGGQPWCLYWRLSYCVILYTPPPTGTPGPEEGILPPDCQENLQTGKTVIGNELCVPSPTP